MNNEKLSNEALNPLLRKGAVTASTFDNSERRRYYGLRIGDIVKCKAYNIDYAEVVDYGFLDNNSVFVKEDGKEPRKVVAEWCDVVTKVEDRL
jgi:hypothetical protein